MVTRVKVKNYDIISWNKLYGVEWKTNKWLLIYSIAFLISKTYNSNTRIQPTIRNLKYPNNFFYMQDLIQVSNLLWGPAAVNCLKNWLVVRAFRPHVQWTCLGAPQRNEIEGKRSDNTTTWLSKRSSHYAGTHYFYSQLLLHAGDTLAALDRATSRKYAISCLLLELEAFNQPTSV